MAVSLYEHNEKAYNSAVQMLKNCGKAAIIHPTGTGKSFIGFKLCEDFSEKTVCWLSPSDYIFKTQIENLKRATNGSAPQNIKFFTYAKLMYMTANEIEDIEPDFIILDEFHRCGAEMWGMGVENLLKTYKNVPVLGLSATAIRYLDNRRDMSDELFDGNIASEMTLGEAIVRGILNSPKYVTALYSYKKDYERCEYRVKHAGSKIVRDAGERYLEALKCAIEKADGKEAEKYYRENGDLLPPQTYVTDDGYKLGQWIVVQRVNRTKKDPALTPPQELPNLTKLVCNGKDLKTAFGKRVISKPRIII